MLTFCQIQRANETARLITLDRRATPKRLARLCRVLSSIARGANDAATLNRAAALAGRLNSACRVVRPEIVIPTDPAELLELRRALMVAAL